MNELIEFLLSRMSDEELQELYHDLGCDENEEEQDCESCEFCNECEEYAKLKNEQTKQSVHNECDDIDCENCELFNECWQDDEMCDCDGDCGDCECWEDCFNEYCDSHEDCQDCDSFDICFKEAFGHKYTIADEIESVKFSGPAIIVFWKDGTKTVSVCSDYDDYDPEKGIAMCILKKLLGNSDYNEVFKRFIPEDYEEDYDEEDLDKYYDDDMNEALNVVEELLQTKKLTERQKEALKILIPEIDE